MAGFKGHLSTATVAGGLASVSLFVAGVVNAQEVVILLSAAIIGGLLPDIDADNSVPLRIAFTFFALLFSFLVMFSQGGKWSVLELTLIWLGAFLFFKLAVLELFIRATEHRGIFHSIPAGLFFAFAAVIFLHHLFDLKNETAWMAGLFLFTGFILHLLLDELFSLNLFGGGGVKYSLGSAFKLFSKNWKASLALYAATIGIYFLTPNKDGAILALLSPDIWSRAAGRFFPGSTWFGISF